MKKNETTKTRVLREVLDLIDKYGYIKIIASAIIMIFISYATYLTFHPAIMFDRYTAYMEEKHNISSNYRMETSPQIRVLLNNLVAETGADRAYIAEFHNGKNNPSGLQWQYADMNFIDDKAEDIRDEYQNISLVRYPLCYQLYKDGTWMGSLKDVDYIDHRLALRLEANDVNYIAASMIYGNNLSEIGFLGVSYTNTSEIDGSKIRQILNKYVASVAPLLDGSKAK